MTKNKCKVCGKLPIGHPDIGYICSSITCNSGFYESFEKWNAANSITVKKIKDDVYIQDLYRNVYKGTA